jgi:hypothetical protein
MDVHNKFVFNLHKNFSIKKNKIISKLHGQNTRKKQNLNENDEKSTRSLSTVNE